MFTMSFVFWEQHHQVDGKTGLGHFFSSVFRARQNKINSCLCFNMGKKLFSARRKTKESPVPIQLTLYLHLTLNCTAIYQVLRWTGRSEDWPGFISCAGPGQSSGLQVDCQGTVGKFPLVQKGIFQGDVLWVKGTFHLPLVIPFFVWLLILISLLGAACFVGWKSPHQAAMGCVLRQICWE